MPNRVRFYSLQIRHSQTIIIIAADDIERTVRIAHQKPQTPFYAHSKRAYEPEYAHGYKPHKTPAAYLRQPDRLQRGATIAALIAVRRAHGVIFMSGQ